MANNAARSRRQHNLAVVSTKTDETDQSRELPVSSSPENQGAAQKLQEAGHTSSAALDALLGKAEALANIDNRNSVLSDAPVNLEHEGRETYEEEEEAAGSGARWGRPSNQEYVWVNSDPANSRILSCVKAKKGGAVYPVSAGMLEKHPELRRQARRYLVRMAVTSVKEGSEVIMWPAPVAGVKDAPSDPSHRLAQKKSMEGWCRTEWDGNKFQAYKPKNPESFGQPKWPDETFDDLLLQTIDDVVVKDETHEFAIQLLGL